jgi:hypothetical protein
MAVEEQHETDASSREPQSLITFFVGWSALPLVIAVTALPRGPKYKYNSGFKKARRNDRPRLRIAGHFPLTIMSDRSH